MTSGVSLVHEVDDAAIETNRMVRGDAALRIGHPPNRLLEVARGCMDDDCLWEATGPAEEPVGAGASLWRYGDLATSWRVAAQFSEG
jgi:hypothetical protein